jgi:hypothetical protein
MQETEFITFSPSFYSLGKMFAKYLFDCCVTFFNVKFVEVSGSWKGLFFGVWQTDMVVVTKYIYLEYHAQCMSPRRNWDSPTPSVAGECAPPPGTKAGWGHTQTAGERLGESQFRRLKNSLALCPLFGGCVQYVFLGLDLEYATNWTDLTRALRLLAGKLIKLHLYKLQKF